MRSVTGVVEGWLSIRRVGDTLADTNIATGSITVAWQKPFATFANPIRALRPRAALPEQE